MVQIQYMRDGILLHWIGCQNQAAQCRTIRLLDVTNTLNLEEPRLLKLLLAAALTQDCQTKPNIFILSEMKVDQNDMEVNYFFSKDKHFEEEVKQVKQFNDIADKDERNKVACDTFIL